MQPGLRRLHPFTPVLKGWKVLVFLAFCGSHEAIQIVATRQDDAAVAVGAALLLAVGVVLAVVAVSWVSWRVTGYWADPTVLHLATGVLFRSEKQARLDRLQAVDIEQPLLARFVGLAELRLDVAGGSESVVKLAYLSLDEAEELRDWLLTHAAGLIADERGMSPRAQDRPLHVVSAAQLIGAHLLGTIGVGFITSVLLLLIAIDVLGVVALLPIGSLVLGLGGAAWALFARDYGFTIGVTDDGVRLRAGLLDTRSQTIAPGRVQALKITQPLLWRLMGWWRIEINVAGYTSQTQQNAGAPQTVLLPVGSKDDMLKVFSAVVPHLGTEYPVPTVLAALHGTSSSLGFRVAPRRSWLLDPVGWRRNGYAATQTVLLLRSGRLTRVLHVVPHERTQSLGLYQGPIQKLLRLSTFRAHSTVGPAMPVVRHLDAACAAQLLCEQTWRARQARALATPAQWMRGS